MDSRRLLGPSLWLDAPGVILEAVLDPARAEAELAAWRERLDAIVAALGWQVTTHVRRHVAPDGPRAALACTAPIDVLLTATLVNEWAWIGAATDGARRAAATMAAEDERLPDAFDAAVARLRTLLAAEANAALLALAERAARARVPLVTDDDLVTLGYGARGRSWPMRALPAPGDVDWGARGTIPVALVTGSNGKTTTVRLVAAMLRAAGHKVGYSCSDGVFVEDECLASGDWSGPEGARRIFRDARVTAAVLETARGGLLRRGLVVPQAAAAIVTNIAEDHFGAYGIQSERELAEVKLGVARALGREGTLVLNGDDATLRAVMDEPRGARAGAPRRVETGSGAGASAPHVTWFGRANPPGSVPPAAQMPLAAGGAAAYNVMNAIGAAYVARALGVPDEAISRTLRTFGAENEDNPGRLQRFELGGVRIWVDYAHNPHGLAALLGAAHASRGDGRVGVLLGQAGDRDDAALRALARAAWDRAPDRVTVKDIPHFRRGRAPGEVPAILRDTLLAAGAPADRIAMAPEEVDGVRDLLAWARPGDLLVLPVHALAARDGTLALVERLRSAGWRPGQPLPGID